MDELWRKRLFGGGSLKEVSKWTGLVAAIWVQAFAGNSAAYANYSSKLKSVLSLTQVQLNYLALCKDLGENVGILAGLVCNKVPPWVILLVAALEGFLGFGSLWLVASGTIDPRPLWQMCIAIFVGGNSTTWFNTAVLVTCMRNFPKSRGTIVGFLKGFVGLSGAIFMQIFFSLLDKNAVHLLLFLAVGPTLLCLLCMGFIRPVKTSPAGASYAEVEEEQKQFRIIYIICIALAIYLFVAAFLDQFVTNQSVSLIVVIVMFLFLVAPSFVPMKALMRVLVSKEVRKNNASTDDPLRQPSEISGEKKSTVHDERAALEEADNKVNLRGPRVLEVEEEDAEVLLALGEGAVKRKKRRPRRGEDFKLKQALIKADYWLLFLTFFCGVGSAITAMDNLSQLGQAQGYTDVSIFVLLSCIWGFLGRLGGGFLSEHFIRSTATPRSFWIGAAQALMIVAHLLFAFALPLTLYPAASIVGLCQGIQIAVTVPTISEIFGLRHFGILYNFIILADPIGSLLFSTLLAGNLYDYEVFKEYGTASTDVSCTGAHCFCLTFLIMAAVCLVGVVVSIILTVRLKPVYVTLYGNPDQTNASYSSLPSGASYTSLPSVNASSSSLPPAQFLFPRVPSTSTLSDSDLH
ncbi:hypothetical protein GOP47_0006653 [Adiantum capillus-veneris]|uniref:Nodulin-like domain-containing protein n=1 Tax=Adiantum capillus-veneris TaxID=13818 RepID=A0A9D4ZM91_ADICA|nr:hypothetical protein GOP47_0006653 [Adiantum capillus-veneris]